MGKKGAASAHNKMFVRSALLVNALKNNAP